MTLTFYVQLKFVNSCKIQKKCKKIFSLFWFCFKQEQKEKQFEVLSYVVKMKDKNCTHLQTKMLNPPQKVRHLKNSM